MRRGVVAVLVTLLVVTAGCAGSPGSGTATALDGSDGESDGASAGGGDGDGADGAGTVTASDAAGTVDGQAGVVNFYVSDEPNDMDDFKHLNVTITSVQFHLVDPAEDDTDDGTDVETDSDDGTDSDAGNATATVGTGTETPDHKTTVETESEAEDDEREEDERDDEGEDESEGEDGRWVTQDVNATTVDLTELRGANATLVEQFALPAGEYDKVFLHVGETEGTLETGESANVKLPSEKLHLNEEFTVENGSEVDFVYDITVHKAGNSGKYILKPVVSESGTDVDIERVDDERDDRGTDEGDRDEERENEREDDFDEDDERADDEHTLNATFLEPVEPGENVTVRVTENGSAVANATVSVDGAVETDGVTDAGGEYVVEVPADAEELEVEVESGDTEGELEWEREEAASEGESDDSDGGDV